MLVREPVNLGYKGKKKCRGMLGDTGSGVTGDVADRDFVGGCGIEIDNVDSRGAYQNQPQVREGLDDPGVENNFVGEDHVRISSPLDHLRGISPVKMRKIP